MMYYGATLADLLVEYGTTLAERGVDLADFLAGCRWSATSKESDDEDEE